MFLLIFLTLPSTSCINVLWHLPNVLNFKLKFIKCVTCDLRSWYIHTTLLFISAFGSQLILCEFTQALSFYFLFSFNIYDYCIFQLLTWLPNAIIWELRRERGRDSTWMPVHKIICLVFSCYIFWRNDIFQLVLMTLLKRNEHILFSLLACNASIFTMSITFSQRPPGTHLYLNKVRFIYFL